VKKKVLWSLGLAIIGLFLAQKQVYWLPGTYSRDIETCSFAIVGCAVAGFIVGCIVERTKTERQRRPKILYWLLVTCILGSFLGLGRGVPVETTVTVLASTLLIGLVAGVFQFFLQPPKAT
jgi:phosphate/sulfate permease